MAIIKVCRVEDLSVGTMKKVLVSGKPIFLVRSSDSIYAVDDLCTHAGCSLSGEGYLDGMKVVCGCHGASFDIVSGKVLSPPALKDLSVYQVTLKDNDIYLNI
jgi:3-phenylpropionate/trans-cinnamate dioxygenase ferredoxin component